MSSMVVHLSSLQKLRHFAEGAGPGYDPIDLHDLPFHGTREERPPSLIRSPQPPSCLDRFFTKMTASTPRALFLGISIKILSKQAGLTPKQMAEVRAYFGHLPEAYAKAQQYGLIKSIVGDRKQFRRLVLSARSYIDSYQRQHFDSLLVEFDEPEMSIKDLSILYAKRRKVLEGFMAFINSGHVDESLSSTCTEPYLEAICEAMIRLLAQTANPDFLSHDKVYEEGIFLLRKAIKQYMRVIINTYPLPPSQEDFYAFSQQLHDLMNQYPFGLTKTELHQALEEFNIMLKHSLASRCRLLTNPKQQTQFLVQIEQKKKFIGALQENIETLYSSHSFALLAFWELQKLLPSVPWVEHQVVLMQSLSHYAERYTQGCTVSQTSAEAISSIQPRPEDLFAQWPISLRQQLPEHFTNMGSPHPYRTRFFEGFHQAMNRGIANNKVHLIRKKTCQNHLSASLFQCLSDLGISVSQPERMYLSQALERYVTSLHDIPSTFPNQQGSFLLSMDQKLFIQLRDVVHNPKWLQKICKYFLEQVALWYDKCVEWQTQQEGLRHQLIQKLEDEIHDTICYDLTRLRGRFLLDLYLFSD